jgi:hypothetical protein
MKPRIKVELTTSTYVSLFAMALTIAFITIKLSGHIEWSWLWVFSPLWIPVASLLTLYLIIFVAAKIARRRRDPLEHAVATMMKEALKNTDKEK